MKKSLLSSEWKEGEIVQGGVFRREFNFIKFIKLVEETHGEVIGLEIEDNNIELLFRPKEKKIDTI